MKIFLNIILLAILFSCNGYQKIVKSNDIELKYIMAKKYYEENEYFKALPLLDELQTLFKGTRKAEEVDYDSSFGNSQSIDVTLSDGETIRYSIIKIHFPNFEMECSALYYLGRSLGHNTLTLCVALGNRITKEYSKNSHKTMNKMINLIIERLF